MLGLINANCGSLVGTKSISNWSKKRRKRSRSHVKSYSLMYDHLDTFKMGEGLNPTNYVWNESELTITTSKSSKCDDLYFDLADILEDPFENLDDLDLNIESNMYLKEAKSDLYLDHDVTISKENNTIEDLHNPFSFLDDLSLQISNVGCIKDEDFLIGQHETNIGISRSMLVNDALDFLITSNGDSFADLDFLNDSNIEATESGSCQPPDPFEEDLSSAEVKFINCDNKPIKSDCMWSSTLNSNAFGDETSCKTHHQGRKRDISFTLSECAEGMTTSTCMEITGVTPLETLHTGGGNMIEGALWNPLNSCSSSENETDDSDEEIDVETPREDVSGSLLQRQDLHKTHLTKKSIEAGCSLLLCCNRLPPVQPLSMYNDQTLIDHNYFKIPPPSPTKKPVIENFKGMLTPTESSDDEEVTPPIKNIVVGSGNVDKLKIAQALQSLINNSAKERSALINKRSTLTFASDNIKFKFKMKFKSNSPQHSILSINNQHAANNNHSKSVSNTALHKSSLLESNNLLRSGKTRSFEVSTTKTRSELSGSSRSNRSTSSSSIANPVEKCRKIRDLHNSMERQRRVDLRKNFEQLKAVVPELVDSEKASKLNILNKASNYCRLLATLNERLTSEQKLESGKNALLRKKLLWLRKSLKQSR